MEAARTRGLGACRAGRFGMAGWLFGCRAGALSETHTGEVGGPAAGGGCMGWPPGLTGFCDLAG